MFWISALSISVVTAAISEINETSVFDFKLRMLATDLKGLPKSLSCASCSKAIKKDSKGNNSVIKCVCKNESHFYHENCAKELIPACEFTECFENVFSNINKTLNLISKSSPSPRSFEGRKLKDIIAYINNFRKGLIVYVLTAQYEQLSDETITKLISNGLNFDEDMRSLYNEAKSLYHMPNNLFFRHFRESPITRPILIEFNRRLQFNLLEDLKIEELICIIHLIGSNDNIKMEEKALSISSLFLYLPKKIYKNFAEIDLADIISVLCNVNLLSCFNDLVKNMANQKFKFDIFFVFRAYFEKLNPKIDQTFNDLSGIFLVASKNYKFDSKVATAIIIRILSDQSQSYNQKNTNLESFYKHFKTVAINEGDAYSILGAHIKNKHYKLDSFAEFLGHRKIENFSKEIREVIAFQILLCGEHGSNMFKQFFSTSQKDEFKEVLEIISHYN